MKTKLLVFAGIVVMLCAANAGYAAVVAIGNSTGSPGDTNKAVPVTVSGLTAGNVTGIDLWLSYNATALNLTDVSSSGTLTQGWQTEVQPTAAEQANLTVPWHYPVYNDSPKGTVKIALYGKTPLNTSGTLTNLIFTVNAGSGQAVPLQLTKGQLNEGQVASTLTPGTFTISAGGGGFAVGDVNQDGQPVGASDLQALVNQMLGLHDWGMAADVNKNGIPGDAGDLQTLVNMLLGL